MQLSAIRTDRLLLRPWREDDLDALAAINADPIVMEHFPATRTRGETAAMIERLDAHHHKHGHTFWAVELLGGAKLIGAIGVLHVDFDAPFAPTTEIGWRLARAHWNQGYATEGARASLQFAFDQLALSEIVAFTIPENARSQAVMTKLGMTRNPAEDFDHPNLPPDEPKRRHRLYRLQRETWLEGVRGNKHGVPFN